MPSRKDRLPSPGPTALEDAVRTAFRVPEAPVLLARDLTYGPLSVTELRCDVDDYGKSEALPEHDALMVSLQLRTSVDHDIWENGKRLPRTPVVAGSTSFFDLRRAVIASSMRPFHCLNFVFPLRVLDEATEDVLYRFERGRVAQQGLEDPVIQALGSSLLPAMKRPAAAPRLFVDHVLFALRAHVAARFGAPAEVARAAQPTAANQASATSVRSSSVIASPSGTPLAAPNDSTMRPTGTPASSTV